jgi:hypothetical protein
MYPFWEFFIQSFPNSSKSLKKIKKAQSLSVYREVVKQIINNESVNSSRHFPSGTGLFLPNNINN